MESFGDILTAMVTPFTLDLQVDYLAFARLADHLLVNGSDGLVVAGTTGESPTLTDDEKVTLFRHAVEVAGGRGPVIAGTGSNDTAHSVALTRRAEDAGVDAVLVVAPYYNKPNERGLRAHFAAIAGATNLPLIIYNIPSRCVIDLSPELLADLAAIDNIVAVKQANPDLGASRRLLELCDLGLYAGNDDMTRDVAAMGGWGCISVASHLVGPRLKELVVAARARRHGARRRHRHRAGAADRGAVRDEQPDTAQGGAQHARSRGGGPAPAAGRRLRRRTPRRRGRAREARPAVRHAKD